MAQRLRTERADGKVTISCLVSDLEFRWQLREATAIQVRVKLPEKKRAGREQVDRPAALAIGGGRAPDPTAGATTRHRDTPW
jgi:hypothetical protein